MGMKRRGRKKYWLCVHSWELVLRRIDEKRRMLSKICWPLKFGIAILSFEMTSMLVLMNYRAVMSVLLGAVKSPLFLWLKSLGRREVRDGERQLALGLTSINAILEVTTPERISR